MQLAINFNFPSITTPGGAKFLWDYLIDCKNSPAAAAPDSYQTSFLSFCLRHFASSNSQFFQDLYVAHKLGHKRNGYFVDFGATDGILGSNSYYFEKELDWVGIVAEPNAVHHVKLRNNRNCIIDQRCVWKESGEKIEFVATAHPDFSTISLFKDNDYISAARTAAAGAVCVMVETVSLNELLSENNAPTDFDYLSIDTEGSEYEILKSLDYKKYRPQIITAEHNHNAALRNDIHTLLTSQGYVREFETFSGVDDWYYSQN